MHVSPQCLVSSILGFWGRQEWQETVNDAAGNLIDAVKRQWDDNGMFLCLCLIFKLMFLCLCLIFKLMLKDNEKGKKLEDAEKKTQEMTNCLKIIKQCPVCRKEMNHPTKIFQCTNGHLICECCKNDLKIRHLSLLGCCILCFDVLTFWKLISNWERFHRSSNYINIQLKYFHTQTYICLPKYFFNFLRYM